MTFDGIRSLLALAFLSFTVAACGSSTPSSSGADMAQPGGGGSGGGGGGGGVPIPDMATIPGFCGGVACTGGTSCCIVGGTPSCMSSCPDGGISAQCQKPTDCPGATDACCITIANYNPQSVACTAGNQCVPMISAQGMGKDRACVTSNDCVDNGASMTMLPDCCTSKASGQHVCFSTGILAAVPSLQQQFSCP